MEIIFNTFICCLTVLMFISIMAIINNIFTKKAKQKIIDAINKWIEQENNHSDYKIISTYYGKRNGKDIYEYNYDTFMSISILYWNLRGICDLHYLFDYYNLTLDTKRNKVILEI